MRPAQPCMHAAMPRLDPAYRRPCHRPFDKTACHPQTWHQCKVVWAEGMAPPLARLPGPVHVTEDGPEEEEEASLLGSLAPAPEPPAALQCHFKPLTGEVCIGEAPPAADGAAGYVSAPPLGAMPQMLAL